MGLKVGMLCDTYYPQVGGAEVHVQKLSWFLEGMGHKVELLTATPGPSVVQGQKVHRFPRLAGGGSQLVGQIPYAIHRVWNFASTQEILHAHYSYFLASISTFVARMQSKPCIVTLHGLGTLDSSVGRSMWRRVLRLTSLRLASTIVATSEEMATVATRFAKPSKIVVVPNGVDTAEFSIESCNTVIPRSSNKIVVLSMRRLNPKNGVQYLVESAPYIVKHFDNIEFWIVGSRRLEDYLKRRTEELGLTMFFRFFPEVPHTETKAYYAAADVVVFPSSAESTSLACLEAMSMQRAVVASSLSVYRDLLGENERGILVRLFDRETSDYNAPMTLEESRLVALARAIKQVAQDADLRRTLGSRAREYVKSNYDWRVIATKIGQVFMQTLLDSDSC